MPCPVKVARNGGNALTDWLEILKAQAETGDQLARDIPNMLSDPEITREQVKALFGALEKQAQFVELLIAALEKFGYDFEIIKAAETLEERYADLAASVAEKLKGMMG